MVAVDGENRQGNVQIRIHEINHWVGGETEDFSRVAQNVYFYLSKFLQNERVR